ncbi:MAG: anaerobic ribonucleoside-triphosphate reductase [Candidatus Omnitrophota bacterium]
MDGKNCSVEVFARVTGFFRPVQSWNKGKAEEFKDRKKYNYQDRFLSRTSHAIPARQIAR